MSAYERLILNPVELTPELPEIDLSAAGIAIGQAGVDYGESSQTVERVRQAVGEGVTSAHWPSVESSVPLIVGARSDTTMAAAFQPVESFVAEVQRRSRGAIRREFADSAGFSGSVVTFVDAAGLTTPRGKDGIDEITLKLSRYPFWFATVEEESAEFKGSSVRDLEFELAELLGTVPGLIRIVVKNEGTEDWRGCIVPLECDDYSPDVTAKPKYEARELTLQGGSTSTEVSGAKVVKCPALTAGWATVLSSQITGKGHMTHVGPRRPLFRINDVSSVLDDVQWKLEWRALGAAAWMQTQEGSTPIIVSSPVIAGYQLLDMGECRIPTALTGEQRWEWRLQARSLSSSGKQPLIRDVYPASTEQWVRVADASPEPSDGAPIRAAGTVEDNSGAGSVAWSEPENAKTEDGSYASVARKFGESTVSTHYLKATNFGFAIPSASTIISITARVVRSGEFSASSLIHDSHIRIIKGGVIKETVDRASSEMWPRAKKFAAAIYGGDLWGQAWTSSDINASGFGIAVAAEIPSPKDLEGKAFVESITLTVAYSETANTETHVCFASRSIEFSDTGPRRQHVTDDVWGDLVGDGFNFYAPAPGQIGQGARGLVIPSVGDFAARPDAAAAKLSAKVAYRPAFLFCREAVS